MKSFLDDVYFFITRNSFHCKNSIKLNDKTFILPAEIKLNSNVLRLFKLNINIIKLANI